MVITPDYTDYAEGSVLIEAGRTRVLCNATTRRQLPRWLHGQGQGWVTAEYALLPRATQQRTPRERGGWGGRTQEIRRMIGRSLRAAVDLTRLGERTVIVDCDVIQADGGTRTACVTGGYVALMLALRRLVRASEVPRRVVRGPVGAVSVGIVEGQALLDLCAAEDMMADVDLNVVMNSRGQYVELQGTAEGEPFDGVMLSKLLRLAEKGIKELLVLQRRALQE